MEYPGKSVLTCDGKTASTIPIVFTTAIYSLKYRANLQPGEVCHHALPKMGCGNKLTVNLVCSNSFRGWRRRHGSNSASKTSGRRGILFNWHESRSY